MIRQTLFTTVLIASLAAVPALAHDHRSERGNNQEARFEYIFDQMELSETQRRDVLVVLREHREERSQTWRERREARGDDARSDHRTREEHRSHGEARERPSADEREARRELHRERSHTELAARLNSVLADDQVVHFMEYLESHRPERHRGGKKRHGERHYKKDR